MVKAIAYSVCAVLLISSTAFGQLGTLAQNQNWNHAATTGLATTGNAGTVGALTAFGTLDTQSATSIYTTTTANQGAAALLIQGGTAANLAGGSASIVQDAGTTGINSLGTAGLVLGASGPGQVQMIAAYDGPAQQFEGVGLSAAQTLATAGGGGSAQALNGIGVGMGQDATSTSATLSQSSFMAGVQIAGATSAPGGDTMVASAVTSQVVQGQSANLAAFTQ